MNKTVLLLATLQLCLFYIVVLDATILLMTNEKIIKFQWDKGNKDKNQDKHQVTQEETETVFFDPKRRYYVDHKHSGQEKRFFLVGKTKSGRLLLVVYTHRGEYIRVISARDINKRKEGIYYEKAA